jgi:hypothetical protein
MIPESLVEKCKAFDSEKELPLVDSATHLKALEEDGYSIHPLAAKFIGCFSDVEIACPAYRGNKDESLHFNPTAAIESVYRERIEVYEERVGQPLVPVGELYFSRVTLLLALDGKIYGGLDDELFLIGSDPYAALLNIFGNRTYEKIS